MQRRSCNMRQGHHQGAATGSKCLTQRLAPSAARALLNSSWRKNGVRAACAPTDIRKGGTVLVGDIGGTNARLSVWAADGPHANAQLFAKIYATEKYSTFDECMAEFLSEAAHVMHVKPAAAALAVAGAVQDNRCAMTNIKWIVDGNSLGPEFGFRVKVLNDFEAVGYGIPVMGENDMVMLTNNKMKPMQPKVVCGPGTGLGAAQLFWDEGLQDYKVWPGEGAHATFAPRGWKQTALAAYAANKLGGHVEIEHLACGSGLELIHEFLLSDEPCNRQGVQLGKCHSKTAAEISKAALSGEDPIAEEAIDMLMAIVGAEAGAMALRCLAVGGVYIAGGITPRVLPRLRASASGGGALLEGFLNRAVRPKFAEILASMPVAVITNGQVGQIGARQVAIKLMQMETQPQSAKTQAIARAIA